jgi:hypothetical protein
MAGLPDRYTAHIRRSSQLQTYDESNTWIEQ